MRNHVRVAAIAAATAAVLYVGVRAQQPASAPQGGATAGQAPAAGQARGGGGGLTDPCGGRSQTPKEACPQDVTRMIATVGLLPEKPPAAPLKARKVLAWSRIPSSGFQHSSIPLAIRTIEAIGKRTGAWTTDIAWDLSVITAENLKQYDAIFLSSTTGAFLDDMADAAGTAARRAAFLDFIRSGKGIGGVHATSDSYRGRGRAAGAAAAPAAAPAAGAAPPAPAPAGAGATVGQGRPGGGGRGPEVAAPGGGRAATPPCSSNNPTPGSNTTEGSWPEWNTMIGGFFKFHWNYPTPITVKIDDPQSPINAAFKGKSFNVIDEVYTFNDKSFSRENVHVLTSIDYNLMSDCDKGLESSPRLDHDYGLSWIRKEGQGRLFYQALGHHESIYYNNPDMLAHILAGMQYALGDLKADDSPSKKK
jgi:type 1 glutamine amidotransferase